MNKINVLEINKSQLGGQLGQICSINMKESDDTEFPYIVSCYIAGELPIKFKSKISQADFERLYR